MTKQDEIVGAITIWRENRGGGRSGMQSVLNVLINRATARGSSVYEEAIRPWQFSSMTAAGDPQLATWPAPGDPQFATALALAQSAADGELADITDGATSYYAQSMTAPPSWAASMKQTVVVEGQIFFKA